MLLGKSKGKLLIAPERMRVLDHCGNYPQLWMCLVVKIQYSKEQYGIETWNVKSVNQGKFDMFKQEMARLDTDILRIYELKWTRMGVYNSYDHYTHYYGQEFLRRNGIALILNKRIQNAVLGCNLKNRMISVYFQGKNIHYYSYPSLCSNH